MKILHILGDRRLPRDPDTSASSGVVNAVLENARAQSELGHQVWIASVVGENWQREWQGVRLIGLESMPWAKIRAGGRSLDLSIHFPYLMLTRRHRFDLVIGNGYSYMRFLRATVRAVTVHSSPKYKGSSSDEDVSFSVKDFLRIASDTDVQFAVSRFVAEELRDGLGARGNVIVAYNGVDLQRFSSIGANLLSSKYRQEWKAEDNTVVFLYAGAITKEKGVIHLARAFADLASRSDSYRLVLAGGSLWNVAHHEYEATVKEILKNAVEIRRAHFLGKVNRTRMPEIYAACDIVVVPSCVQEAFPLVALESLASGKPVIASRVGGISETIVPDVGILVHPGDEDALREAMMQLAGDRELRSRLASAAQLRAKGFSWSATAQTIDAAYWEVLQNRKGM